MPTEYVVSFASFLQSCVPLLSLTAYLPQWRKLVATKSSKDISLRSWLIWTFSGSIGCFYAIVQYKMTGRGAPLIFSSATILIFVMVTVCLVIIYRKKTTKTAVNRLSIGKGA